MRATALAHIPVIPMTNPTINDVIGNAGGCGNGEKVCDMFATLS